MLNPDEVLRFLDAVDGFRNRVALVWEVTRLKVASIDRARHIEIEMLSPRLLEKLRAYSRRAREGLI